MLGRRVVITGVGMVSPLGPDVRTSWAAMLAGKSGISKLTGFDVTKHTVKIGGQIPDFDLSTYISPKDSRRMDNFIQLGLAAGVQAVSDSEIDSSPVDLRRVGVSIGSGIGGINTIETCHDVVINKGPTKVSPFFVPSSIINMVSGHLSIRYGFRGPNLAISTACTTGLHNIGLSARLIMHGDADIMVAGGAEKATCPTTIAGFAAMRALSLRNDDPTSASRPWDRDRDGFVLSDGAGAIVLEEYEHAKKRGARIYCELIGFGMSADADHMTSPSRNGSGAADAMKNALNDARIPSANVHYINAHGTSTALGDLAETAAIKSTFGSHASKLLVSSTKSMHGHALGAAGAIEAIVTICAIQDQVAPPTINLENPSDGCDLDYVAGKAKETLIDVAMSNSFGFGGTNGSLVLKKIA